MAAAVLTVALVAPVFAHTDAQIINWQNDWNQRVEANGWDLSVELADERASMIERHPCRILECPQPKEVIASERPRPDVAVATPPSVGTGMGNGNVEQWRGLVAAYTGWDVDRMLRIMNCESGGSPTAYNGATGVAGLFQIHPLWQKVWPGDYYDPATNVAVAYQVWLEQGYGAWVCRG